MQFNKVSALALAAAFVVVTAGSAFALDRHVKIHNRSSTTLTEFYASNVRTNDYEEDILDDGVIKSGRAMNINIDDGTGYCKYDFLAVFSDGSQAKKNNVNVCEVSDFYFDD
jgi:hypothetical protein